MLASNDNWGGGSVLANLALAAGAMPLPATSKDAAVNFVPSSTGAYTVTVGGTGGATGVALLEIFEVDAQRAGVIPPAVVSNPENVSVGAGQPATFGVVTTGKPPPSYQWRRNGGAILGATSSSYTVLAAQAADAGLYDVVVSNESGGIVSGSASLTVGAATGSFATHAVVGPGYVPGGAVTISCTLGYVGTPGSLAWSVVLPAGWSYVSGAGDLGAVTPRAGDTGTLGWAWTTLPPSPVRFTYTVNVPAGENVARTITASAIIRPQSDPVQTIVAAPASLVVERVVAHSADSDQDYHIGLFELTRVIELYNTRNGSVRTGCYAVASSVTEDGFTPDPTRAATAIVVNGRVHSADSDRDGRLTLVELTRVIELYNTRSGTTRTGQYHVQAGTEDGFAPGP